LGEIAKIRIAAFCSESKMLRRGNLVSFVGKHASQVQLSVAQIGAKPDSFGVFPKGRVYLTFTF
jgi:hypothetical protein